MGNWGGTTRLRWNPAPVPGWFHAGSAPVELEISSYKYCTYSFLDLDRGCIGLRAVGKVATRPYAMRLEQREWRIPSALGAEQSGRGASDSSRRQPHRKR
jgi:hypothetical protein